MGPRLFRRGNRTCPGCVLDHGHVFNGATSFQTWKSFRSTTCRVPFPSSMGPRLFRRGNLVVSGIVVTGKRSSMGPRLFRRGNRRAGRDPGGDAVLQWGHVFSDVEIRFRPMKASLCQSLQWGHVFSDVEITADVLRRLRESLFNGATSFQTWKSRVRSE